MRSHRPLDLPPVPGGDEGDLEELPALQEGERVGRSKRRLPSREARDGDDRRSGVESSSTPEFSEKAVEKTEGRMPSDDGLEHGSASPHGVDELQRSLEKEMMAQLHEENLMLKQELEKQKEKSSRSSWSAVSLTESAIPAAPTSTPPRSRTPTRREGGINEPRFTPHGTRVPEGPPPCDGLPALPAWPFEKVTYEVCEDQDPCHRRLGPRLVTGTHRPESLEALHGKECAGGANPRHGEVQDANGRRGGVNPRQGERHGCQVSRGGAYPRHGEEEEAHFLHGDVLSGAAARAVWLERELLSLKRVIEEDCRQRKPALTGSYWQAPTTRWSPRLDGQKDHEEVRGTRAFGNHEEVHGTRAFGNHEEVHGTRAFGNHEEVRGTRAFGSHGEVCGARALGTHGSDCDVRADGISGEVRGDRAFGTPDDLRSYRAFYTPEEGRDTQGCGTSAGVQRGQGVGTRVGLFDEVHDGRGGDKGQGGNQDDHSRCQTKTSAALPGTSQQTTLGSEITGSGLKLELPSLPKATTPMDLGDWLILIGPIMRDLSQHATTWWERTLEAATKYYEVWRTASPLQRVQLQVSLPLELAVEPFFRTEQRGVGLLLRAVPEELRKVLISNRDVSSTAILWRLLTTFQPGGAGEKAHLLKALTVISSGSSALDISTELRQWRRCFQRAREIGAALPPRSGSCCNFAGSLGWSIWL